MTAPLNLIAIPLLAGLAAGGGTLANYIGGSTSAPVEIAKPADRSCDAQTWPYLDAKCLSRASNRSVRLVMAPHAETTDATEDAVPAAPSSAAVAPDQAAPPDLTSRSTVLYQQPNTTPGVKIPRKRSDRASRRSARLYQVPSESRSGSRALIVVRPLRLNASR